jgi:hypothetical protein
MFSDYSIVGADSLSVDVLLRNPNISKVLSLGYQSLLGQIQKVYFRSRRESFVGVHFRLGSSSLSSFYSP